MQQAGGYRFVKTRVERLSLWSGEDSWYRIDALSGTAGQCERPLLACHVHGNARGGETTFHRWEESRRQQVPLVGEALFRLTPRRKVLNLSWDVSEGAAGPRIATVRLFVSRGLRVADADDREQYRVVDPQGALDRFMQDVLDGCCTEYAIVDDDRVIGGFERRERPRPESAPDRGLLGRLLGGSRRHLVRDWCISLAEGGKLIADHRPLLAAFVLLQEQTIRVDQSS
jgi:hypothetical protein